MTMMNPQFSYTGTDNLEAMASAINYNGFLLDLVRSAAKPGQMVMDFGAGIGTFAGALRNEGHDVLCVELDAIQAAEIRRAGLRVVRRMDEVGDASVDFVYSFNVLEHIDDDSESLSAIRRKMKAGGRILIYVPAFAVLFTDMDRLVGHVRRYSAIDLKEKLQRAGFRVADVRYADSLGFFATLLYKWTNRSSGRIDSRALAVYDRFVFPLSRALDRAGLSHFFGKNVVAFGIAE